MKACSKCKTMLEDDEMFCHECGAKQEIHETEIQDEETQPQSEGKKCINCSETIETDSMFCPFCGKTQDVIQKKTEKIIDEYEIEETQNKSIKKCKYCGHPFEFDYDFCPVCLKPQTLDKDKESPKVNTGFEDSKVEQEVTQEEPAYEEEGKKSSKKWFWILLALLVVGAGGWYFYDNSGWSDDRVAQEEAIDTDSIPMPDEQEEYTEETPTSEIGFLNQFYKGEIGDEGYIQQHVTANVLNKLKRDYEYECPSNDCIATWVFTAYPPGADLELEEGPIITKSKEADKYSVYYSYYTQGKSGRIYHPAGLLVSVTQVDGKYLISDYELFLPDGLQSTKELSADNDGTYYLQDGRMFLTLNKKGKEIEVKFDFRDGTYVSATYTFSCVLDDENHFQSKVQKYNGEMSGQIEGTLNEGLMKVDVRVDNKYSGEYELKKNEN